MPVFNCSQCDELFETKNKLDNHRKKEHQRAGKLTFGYGNNI